MWVLIAVAVAILGIAGIAFVATRGTAEARREILYLADEFQRFLARERPDAVLERTDMLLPVFRTPDGRTLEFAPLVQKLLEAGAMTPEQRYPIYRTWAADLVAGRLPATSPAAVASSGAASALEQTIRQYLLRPGTETQEVFLECLLGSQLFVPSTREPDVASGAFAGLITDTPQGPFLVSFTDSRHVTAEIADAHAIKSGTLVDAAFVLRSLPDGTGLVLNPGLDELVVILPAEGLAQFKRDRGLTGP